MALSRAPAEGGVHGEGFEKVRRTGGWGFGRFIKGEPAGDMELCQTCFPRHEVNVRGHDFAFTRKAE